jgi:hypothetical protein
MMGAVQRGLPARLARNLGCGRGRAVKPSGVDNRACLITYSPTAVQSRAGGL